jgi:hypothetical protein
MSISVIQVLETQRTVDKNNGFTPLGGQAPSAQTPAVVQATVTMSGAADYAVGGYSLTPAQLGLTTAVQSASVNGPTGSIGAYGVPGPSTGAMQSNVTAQYNTSTNKLQFFTGQAELAISSAVAGQWLIVARGY